MIIINFIYIFSLLVFPVVKGGFETANNVSFVSKSFSFNSVKKKSNNEPESICGCDLVFKSAEEISLLLKDIKKDTENMADIKETKNEEKKIKDISDNDKKEVSNEEIIEDDEDDFLNEETLKVNTFDNFANFRGILNSEFKQDRVLENGLEDATEIYNSMFLELEYQYSKNIKIMLSSRFNWYYLLERNESDGFYYLFNGENPKTVFEHKLEESYIDMKKKNFSLRIGQQYFKWGENNAYSRSDVINPIDIKDSIIPELDKRRVAVFSITGKYNYKDDASFVLAFIPFRYNPEISFWGRDFSMLQPSKDLDTSVINNFVSTTIEEDLQKLGMATQDQKKDLTDSSIAMNFSFEVKKMNVSFVYYYGFQELPEIYFDEDFKKLLFNLLTANDQTSLMPLVTSVSNKYLMGEEIMISKFTRYTHYSFSASLPLSSFILKADLSYSPDKLFYTDIDTEDAYTTKKSFLPVYKKYFAYTLGFEYQYGGDKFFWDFEYFGSKILNHRRENYFYDRENRMGVFSMIRYNLNDDYGFVILGNYDIFFKDYLFTFRLVKHVKNFDLNFGYNHFGGDSDTPIGRYDKNDEFFFKLKYYF